MSATSGPPPRILYEPDVGSPEDWACIEEALGVKDFDPVQRMMLRYSIRSPFRVYIKTPALAALWEGLEFRQANLIRALDRLEQDTRRLRNDLSFWVAEDDDAFAEVYANATAYSDEELNKRLDALTLANAAKSVLKMPFTNVKDNEAFIHCVDCLLAHDKRNALLARLDELIADVDNARRRLGRDEGGRKNDWRLQMTIESLALVYFDTTGKTPGLSRSPLDREVGGPFFRFVKAAFRVYAPHRLKGDEALVKWIKKARKGNWPRAKQGN